MVAVPRAQFKLAPSGMLRRMPAARSRPTALGLAPWLLVAWTALSGCPELPASFARVDAEAARELLARDRAQWVSAIAQDDPAPAAGGPTWRVPADAPLELDAAPDDLPDGDLLVVAQDAELGMRLAAALARPRNRRIWLYIPGSAEERQSVYVVRSPNPPEKEDPRGADS